MLKNIAIHTPTQKEFDEVIKSLEEINDWRVDCSPQYRKDEFNGDDTYINFEGDGRLRLYVDSKLYIKSKKDRYMIVSSQNGLEIIKSYKKGVL
jgi:hypothetical protein